MEAFRNWYIQYQDQISWFLIGFLVNSGLTALGEEHYLSALLSFGIAYLNYILTRTRL